MNWIDVNDRLPEKLSADVNSSDGVIVFSKRYGVTLGSYDHNDKQWDVTSWEWVEQDEVTHWMPLPDKPQ